MILFVATTALVPASASAQAVAAGETLPSREIFLDALKAESRNHDIIIERPRRLNVSHGIEDSLSRRNQYRVVYELRLEPGQALQIDLSSKSLDMLLRAYDDTGRFIAENDDWGGSRNSRLFLASVDKRRTRFYIVATATRNQEGYFQLEVRERETPRLASNATLSTDSPVAGTLDSTSALNLEKQAVYERYTFEGAAGERIRIVATPQDTPVGIELTAGGKTYGKAWTQTPGRPTSISGTLARTGPFELLVTGSPAAVSPYRLEFTKLPQARQSTERVVSVGQPITGAFAADSPVVPGTNRPYALYRLNGVAGQSVKIRAEMSTPRAIKSGALEVEVGENTPIGFAALSKRGLNLLSQGTTFERDGSVLIRVMADSGTTGPYTLFVQAQARPEAPSTLTAE